MMFFFARNAKASLSMFKIASLFETYLITKAVAFQTHVHVFSATIFVFIFGIFLRLIVVFSVSSLLDFQSYAYVNRSIFQKTMVFETISMSSDT